jgi:hypothetical protein
VPVDDATGGLAVRFQRRSLFLGQDGAAGAQERGIRRVCGDGCMFPNGVLEIQQMWNTILDVLAKVRDAQGWTK